MPITFTKEEVKEFLKEQGFDVSNENTLKNFIHDLKKLVKYEDMRRRRKKLGHLPDETVLDSTDGSLPSTGSTLLTYSSPTEDDDENDENSRRQFQRSIDQGSITSSGQRRENPRSPARLRALYDKYKAKKREVRKSPVRERRIFVKWKPAAKNQPTGSDKTTATDDPPVKRPPSPVKRPPSPVKRPPSPVKRPPSPVKRPPSPVKRPPPPVKRPPIPVKKPTVISKESARKPLQSPPPTSRRPLTKNSMRSKPSATAPPTFQRPLTENSMRSKPVTPAQSTSHRPLTENSMRSMPNTYVPLTSQRPSRDSSMRSKPISPAPSSSHRPLTENSLRSMPNTYVPSTLLRPSAENSMRSKPITPAPSSSHRPLTENSMRSLPNTFVPPAPPTKKQQSRLIMKRITASQDINGDSIIEESDVDLGPVRRPFQYQPVPPKKKPPVFARPKTAPTKQEAIASLVSRSEPVSRPMSSISVNNNKAKQSQDKDIYCDPEEIDTDELFQAISELILPTGRLDSDECIFEDEYKKLLKPPPHVARDPVLLYHWYKTYNWDLYTIPGEDRHMKLRWNVRAKTVGGYHPCVELRKTTKPKEVRKVAEPKLCRYIC